MTMRDFSTRPRRRALPPAELALVAASGVAFLVSAYGAAAAWKDLRRAQARVAEVRQETEAVQARTRDREAQREPADAVAYQALLTSEAPPPRVLADLIGVMPGDVRLDAVTLTYGDPLRVQVDVIARSAPAYDQFLDRLQRSPLFADVLPGDENRDGELRTSIQMTYRVR
jgi:hypothetical protein